MLAVGVEDNGDAALSGATGAARTVNVGFAVVGEVMLHDQLDIGNVQATGGNIGGNQNAGASGTEALERTFALALRQIAVNRLGLETAMNQLECEFVAITFGAGEDDGAFRALHGQEIREDSGASGRIDLDRKMGRCRLRGVLITDKIDLDWTAQIASSQLVHPARNGCREQHRLTVLRGKLEDLLDGLLEAHGEHLVGLVQDRDLQFVESERTATEVIDHTTGRTHNDVHAALQVTFLRRVTGAAINRGRGKVRGARLEFSRNLLGEFTGRGEDQGARLAATLTGNLQPGGDGQTERKRFASAGAGATKNVLALKRVRQGLFLNRRGCRDASSIQAQEHARREREV